MITNPEHEETYRTILENLRACGVDRAFIDFAREHSGDIGFEHRNPADYLTENEEYDGSTNISIFLYVNGTPLLDASSCEMPDYTGDMRVPFADIHIDSSEKVVEVYSNPTFKRLDKESSEDHFQYLSGEKLSILESAHVNLLYDKLKKDMKETFTDFEFIEKEV